MKRESFKSIMLVMFLTAVLMISGALGTISADAESRGDTLTYTITLKGMYPNVKSAGLSLEYDAEIVELIGGSWTLSNVAVSDIDGKKGKGVILFQKVTTVMGEVATVQFRVRDDAPEQGTTEIKGDIRFMNDQNVPQTIESFVLGTVTIGGGETASTEEATLAPIETVPASEQTEETAESFEPYTGSDTEPSADEIGSGEEDLPDAETQESSTEQDTSEETEPSETDQEILPTEAEPNSGGDGTARSALPIPLYFGIGIAVILAIALVVILIIRSKEKGR